MSEQEFLKSYNIHDFDVPLCSVDMSIFGVIDGELNVLLVKRDEHPEKDKWALPGGFIDLKKDKDIDSTAYRKLKEKTGIRSPYLEQIQTIGGAMRDARGWSITVLYYALIDANKVKGDLITERSHWVPVSKIKKLDLAFDHKVLIKLANERLKAKTTYSALPIELMPKDFTLTELQTVFEIILERDLQLKAFRRRLLAADLVEETGNSKIAGKRPAKLYRSTGKDRNTTFSQSLKVQIGSMKKKIVYIDMDDTLCDLQAAAKAAKERNPKMPYPQLNMVSMLTSTPFQAQLKQYQNSMIRKNMSRGY